MIMIIIIIIIIFFLQMVDTIDPDAPIREGKSLHQEDEQEESRFLTGGCCV